MYAAAETPANCPTGYASLITANNGDVGLQIAGGYNSDNLWFRGWYSSGATYMPWRKVWHEGNLVVRSDSYVAGTIAQRDGNGNLTAHGFWTQGDGSFVGNGAGITGYASQLKVGDTNSIAGAVWQGLTWTGIQQFLVNKGNNSYGRDNNTYTQFFSNDLGSTGFSWHRGGAWATNMTLDPDNVIRMGGWSAAADMFQFNMGNGDFTARSNIVAYSDERLKTNWRPVCDDFVQKWAGVKHGVYTRIDTLKEQIGLSAQAAQAIHEEFVEEQADGYLALNYGAAAAIATIKLAQKIVAQDEIIERLTKRLEALEIA
jgi:hypothetical protein